MSSNLPPGTTDAAIDRAAPGQDEPHFYCWRYEYDEDVHCAIDGLLQCLECALSDSKENDDVQRDYDEERESGWSV